MSMTFWQRLAILTLFGLSAGSLSPAALQAAQFEQQEIDQSRFIILAAPGGDIGYKLLILEQLNDKRPCWSETEGSPSNVDPLLLSFDFTGICNRIVDSNGFSVRTAGEDQGLQYSLRILRQDNDLVLVAASNTQRNTYVEIGRTNGLPGGFSRIVLDPGWRLTRRAFNGRPVGHVYLTYDQPIESLLAVGQRNGGTFRPSSPVQQPNSFPNSIPPENQETPGVIPVPSLPPAAPDGTIAPPRGNSQPSGPAIPQSGNLGGPSIVLPPPSSPDPAAAPIALPGGSIPTNQGAAGNTAGPNSGNQAVQPTTGSRPVQSSTSGSVDDATVSSTGRRFPASLRRNAASSTPTSTAQAGDRTSSENSVSAAATDPAAQSETYQVVVVADNAEAQDKVRAVVPNAFLTTINGQVVMQVGMFRDRQDADQLQQRLSLEGLPTAVIPVR